MDNFLNWYCQKVKKSNFLPCQFISICTIYWTCLVGLVAGIVVGNIVLLYHSYNTSYTLFIFITMKTNINRGIFYILVIIPILQKVPISSIHRLLIKIESDCQNLKSSQNHKNNFGDNFDKTLKNQHF